MTKQSGSAGPRPLLGWRRCAQENTKALPAHRLSPCTSPRSTRKHSSRLCSAQTSEQGPLAVLSISLSLSLSLSLSTFSASPSVFMSLRVPFSPPHGSVLAWRPIVQCELGSGRNAFGQARPFWPPFQQRGWRCCQLSKHRPSRAAALVLLLPVMLQLFCPLATRVATCAS